MPQVSMRRTKQTKEFATYEQVEGKTIVASLTLKAWTLPTPPFPERIRVNLGVEEEGLGGAWRDEPPTNQFPMPEDAEPAKD